MTKSDPSPRHALSLLRLLLVMTLVGCGSALPQEPTVPQDGELASQTVRSGVIEHGDGIAPDTVAFVGRIVEWDGDSQLGYLVEADSSTILDGAISNYQVQLTFEFDPTSNVRLTFTAWVADVDTARLIWTSNPPETD